jgi:SAM-dependent methyltransferase
MAAAGVTGTGVDFAEEMISLCMEKQLRTNTKEASFVHASIFDYQCEDRTFDIISAQGLIEYISFEELNTLLAKCSRMISPGGWLVFGSRNRLFNLFSLNDYTRMELDLGTVDSLMTEALALATAGSMEEGLQSAAQLSDDLPVADSHPETKIGVSTRHQYTPGQLTRICGAHGFRAKTMFAVHYHAFVPAFAKAQPELHGGIANTLCQDESEDPRLVPQSSTFVIAAQHS